MAHNLTRLIAEGAGEGDVAADGEMRSEVVATYLDLLDRPKLSDVLLMVRLLLMRGTCAGPRQAQRCAAHGESRAPEHQGRRVLQHGQACVQPQGNLTNLHNIPHIRHLLA